MLSLTLATTVSAKTIKLSNKNLAITKGKTKTISIKNVKSKNIKSVKVKLSKKKIVKVTKKSKNKLKIKALKKGRVNVAVTVRYKKTGIIKTKKLKLLVKVKAKKVSEDEIVKPTYDGKGILIKAKDAVLSAGKDGMPKKDVKNSCVMDMSTNAGVEYTVPSDTSEDTYDVYLEIGHSNNIAGETMYSITVNGKDHYCIPAKIKKGDFNVLGRFMMGENLKLKAGDKIKVIANFGYNTFNMPYIGDIALYKAGSSVATGYDNQIPKKETTNPSDSLSGKNIIWLGSSVTYGYGGDGYSMADAIEERHANTRCYKYAINGTTLVNETDSSYVARMKKDINVNTKADLFIVQLSTNDASQNKPLGTLTDSFDINSFDDKTVIGAIETIIAYVKANWDCPIYFYTGTQYDSAAYQNMVLALQQVASKWDIGIIDLWNNDMNMIDKAIYKSYMKDPIHPNKKGYVEWWTPEFEKVLK